MHWKQLKLEKEGSSFITSEKGNSMSLLLTSGQDHELTPAHWDACEKEDIVFCKVRGRYYTHLVLAKHPKRGVLIGNAKRRVNGWTTQVYGKVTKRL